MFAPMSLMTYEETRPWARAIKQRVVKREMPPWTADAPHGVFKNDPRLSQKEIDTIAAWVDGGALRGDDRDLPAPPTFAEGWTIGKPDAIFTMTEEFKVPVGGHDPVPVHPRADAPHRRQVDPGDRVPSEQSGGRASHHRQRAARGRRVRTTSARRGASAWAASRRTCRARPTDPGVARRLPANSEIILQMHYTTNGAPTSDRTSIGVIYAKEPPKKMLGGGMILNVGFTIPPGADNHEVEGKPGARAGHRADRI